MSRYIKEYKVKEPSKYYIHKIIGNQFYTMYKSFGIKEEIGHYGDLPRDFDWKGNKQWKIVELEEEDLFLEMV